MDGAENFEEQQYQQHLGKHLQKTDQVYDQNHQYKKLEKHYDDTSRQLSMLSDMNYQSSDIYRRQAPGHSNKID